MNTIFKMKHETINFTSLNKSQVDFYENVLKNETADNIKKNKISGRHALLLNMGLAGNAPLFDEYMHIRGIIAERIETSCKCFKGSSTYIAKRDEIEYKVRKEIENQYGWII